MRSGRRFAERWHLYGPARDPQYSTGGAVPLTFKVALGRPPVAAWSYAWSLQIAILKVLVSHPEGRATIAALKSDLCRR